MDLMDVTPECPHYTPYTQWWTEQEGEVLPCPPTFQHPCSHPDYQTQPTFHLWQEYMEAEPNSEQEDRLGTLLANQLREFEMTDVEASLSELELRAEMAQEVKQGLLDVYSTMEETRDQAVYTA